MAHRFCSICHEPTAADSLFCERHFAQASLFSKSFAVSSAPAAAAAAPTTSPSQATRQHVGAAPWQEALESALPSLWEILGTVNAQKREPQLAFYFLNGKWWARIYFIYYTVFSAAAAQAAQTLDPRLFKLKQGLAEEGELRNALAHVFNEHAAALISGQLQALTMDFNFPSSEVRLQLRTPEDVLLLKQSLPF